MNWDKTRAGKKPDRGPNLDEPPAGEKMPTKELDLDAIRVRVEMATPGPWERFEIEDSLAGDSWICLSRHDPDDPRRPLEATMDDMEFCQHSRTDIPLLLDEVERLRARIEDLESFALGRERDIRGLTQEIDRLKHGNAELEGMIKRFLDGEPKFIYRPELDND